MFSTHSNHPQKPWCDTSTTDQQPFGDSCHPEVSPLSSASSPRSTTRTRCLVCSASTRPLVLPHSRYSTGKCFSLNMHEHRPRSQKSTFTTKS
jgi:hypothetical protein